MIHRLLKRLTDKRVQTIADVYIGGVEDVYLKRWFIIPRNRFFNIYLHEFHRPDDDRALHDHPWWSVSIVLDGAMGEWYKPKPPFNRVSREVFDYTCRFRVLQPGDVTFRNATTPHRITLNTGQTCRTLFFTGPVFREWGFWCPQGWRHWKVFTSYDKTGDSTKTGRGCGED